jgi:hypothetical protein
MPSATKIVLLLATLALALPASAAASPSQLSIIQDDAIFLGGRSHDPDAAMREARLLGNDVVRTFMTWERVSPAQRSRTMPRGFNVGDPNSPGYNWSAYDGLVLRAKKYGLKVFITLGPPIPHWASEQPRRCPHFIGGYPNLGLSCMWKPKPKLFGEFVKAAALRYGSQAPGPLGGGVVLWSMWNEPNLEHYLYPQLRRTRSGTVDVAAKRYRQLWWEGYKAIERYDPALRNRVLFGETAAISSPLDTLYAALCLNEQGRPFRGRLRRLQGCSGRPRRLPIGGVATHPYNNLAKGSVFSRSFTLDSLPMAYLPRLHKLMNRAARYGRIPRGRGIYLTEFGFQSNPPDPIDGLRLDRQARAINEAERLFFADRRVRAVSQFELYDVEDREEYQTGLREFDGKLKPSWRAWRMPLVITRLSANLVEVWGQVRPAEGRTPVTIQARPRGGAFATVAGARTNPTGYFRLRLRRPGAARLAYRTQWTPPGGGQHFHSRTAAAGRKIRYQKEFLRPGGRRIRGR